MSAYLLDAIIGLDFLGCNLLNYYLFPVVYLEHRDLGDRKSHIDIYNNGINTTNFHQ